MTLSRRADDYLDKSRLFSAVVVVVVVVVVLDDDDAGVVHYYLCRSMIVVYCLSNCLVCCPFCNDPTTLLLLHTHTHLIRLKQKCLSIECHLKELFY